MRVGSVSVGIQRRSILALGFVQEAVKLRVGLHQDKRAVHPTEDKLRDSVRG